ncbi:MAG: hypothetical protein RJB01_517 [Actinomycetota bacterium]
MQVTNKVFVVTGAGNGMGREVALGIATRGGRVVGIDRSQESLRETAELVMAASGAGKFGSFTVDLTDRDHVAELPDLVIREFGQVDGVINVAGIIQRFVNIADLDIAEIERVMNINFWGTLLMDKAFLPLLLKRPEACLVNVSSMGALVPVPGQGAYGASKAAVALLTETLYAELMNTSVAVTLVYPGAIATNIAANSGVSIPGMAEADVSSMKMTSASDAADQIIDAVEKGTFRVLIGSDARNLDRMSRIMPTKSIGVVAKQMKKLLG